MFRRYALTRYMQSEIMIPMKSVDEKIDELAQATAIGFAEMRAEFSQLTDQFSEFRTELRADMQELRHGIRMDMENMFERFFEHHVGPLRTDHDVLAGRVKRLEERVFA